MSGGGEHGGSDPMVPLFRYVPDCVYGNQIMPILTNKFNGKCVSPFTSYIPSASRTTARIQVISCKSLLSFSPMHL